MVFVRHQFRSSLLPWVVEDSLEKNELKTFRNKIRNSHSATSWRVLGASTFVTLESEVWGCLFEKKT